MLLCSVILVSMALAVHLTGGPPSVYANLSYIASAIAAVKWGMQAGVGVGLLAAVLIAPILGSTESWNEWFIRVAIYAGHGALIGWLSAALKNAALEEEQTNEQSIRAFVQAIDAKHHDTAGHSERVAEYALMIAQQLNLEPKVTKMIELVSRLHDVGKIATTLTILDKPGPLNDAEWVIIRRHPLESERIIGEIVRFRDLLPAIRGHHEAWNGSGYPDGLKGPEIPLVARIVCIADAWDAMTSDRAYRKALSKQEALSRLLAASGVQFDPRLVNAFIAAMGMDSPDSEPDPSPLTTSLEIGVV